MVGEGDGVGGGVVVGDGGPVHHDAGKYDDLDDSGDDGTYKIAHGVCSCLMR